MKTITKASIAGAALALALAGAATAQTAVFAVTDLNVRVGPGPHYAVVGVLPANAAVTLEGCLEGSRWCSVTYAGGQGWVYSNYLAADDAGTRLVVTEHRAVLDVPVIVHDGAGIATGGVVEAVAGPPPVEVRRYIFDNPAEPVLYRGDVLVGASIPGSVELHAIPDYRYDYVYLNDRPVLVERATRQVVYVLR